ncbi:hypothetical protein MASR2M79_07350 [Aminivibrio sp.]
MAVKDKDLLLDIRNLSVRFDTDSGIVKAVNSLNLSLEKGKSLGFVGETGAGKTTTALAILHLIQSPPGKITAGEILFEGQDILKMTEAERQDMRGSKIAMIFQDPMTSLNPIMTVEEQIMEMISLHSDLKGQGVLKRAHEMLSLVGIRPERGKEYPHQFSGGMRQRVGIAIALACRPRLLIADEPTTALDVTIQAQVIDLIKNLQKVVNTSMLLITPTSGSCPRSATTWPSCTPAISWSIPLSGSSTATPCTPTPRGCSMPFRSSTASREDGWR